MQRFQFEDSLEKGYTHILVYPERRHVVKVNPKVHHNNANWILKEVDLNIPVEDIEKEFEKLKDKVKEGNNGKS